MDLDISFDGIQTAPRQQPGRPKYLLQYLGDGVFALQTDNSSLEVMMTCPRKYLFQVVFQRSTGPAAPLTYGSAIHHGLEVWYKRPHNIDIRDEAYWLKICEAATEAWDYTFDPSEWRTLDRAIDTLSRYRAQYPHEPFEVLEVEKPFSVPLGELEINAELDFTWNQIVDPLTIPNDVDPKSKIKIKKLIVFWTGKIDIVAEENSRLWIWDHKTSSVLGQSYFDQFELANQTLGYSWAANQIEPEPIFGFGLNVIISRKVTRTGVPNEFHRRKFPYPKHRVDEFPHNTMSLVETLVSYLIKNDFPKQSSWCVSKYMQKCPFFEVCEEAPENRGAILFSDRYVHNTWSPLD